MVENETEIRVRYVETDQMAIVHHSVYLHWMEVGRTEYLREKGLSYAQMEKMGVRMPLVEAKLEYFSPALYDDVILIKTKLLDCTKITFTFQYEIYRKSDKKLLTRGMTKHVAADLANKPKRVSKEILSIIGG
jgi:acyl-CoA thioester hydrolase